MKVVPILHELSRRDIPGVFVHTGQHYDVQMSDALLRDLDAPVPDVHLEVGSGSHAQQTARVMERFEPVLLERRPAWIVVVGDVNSTLACALVASKLRSELDCRIAHVESGLRSDDWHMPEEVNRVLTDRLSDLLLTPIPDALANIEREGLDPERAVFVGNVMIDALHTTLSRARALEMAKRFGLKIDGYVVATLHRPSNVDDSERLEMLLEALGALSRDVPVVFPMHPRTRARIAGSPLEKLLGEVVVTEPLGYAEMLGLLDSSTLALTDSGGVQQETTVLGVPCVTVRDRTEWPLTIGYGTNQLATWPPTAASLVHDAKGALARSREPVGARAPDGWDGHAARRIVDALCTASVS
ncbi:MAG TPA: UDP-N-acetylglucosamine 2-epimerase (non-hydrolyzing) [Gemmatimonadaceae bacterium]|jgi:UDP-N-acetylglucosamine 2-epimerase (non-hydrolysing)